MIDPAWREFRRILYRDAQAILPQLGRKATKRACRALVDQEIARLKRLQIYPGESSASEGDSQHGIQSF
jgi:hypothetical protein